MSPAQIKAIREIATTSTPYAFTLQFRREFTRGNLVGLTHDDTLGFCCESDAHEWVSSVNAASAKGTVNYKVISWKVV